MQLDHRVNNIGRYLRYWRSLCLLECKMKVNCKCWPQRLAVGHHYGKTHICWLRNNRKESKRQISQIFFVLSVLLSPTSCDFDRNCSVHSTYTLVRPLSWAQQHREYKHLQYSRKYHIEWKLRLPKTWKRWSLGRQAKCFFFFFVSLHCSK